MLLVEYSILDKVKVINEGTGQSKKLKVRGKFQKCDEANNNGRVYPRKILESQVKEIQSKINERALVGALDHPANDSIHLSQASHLITKLWVEKNGDVMGEAEILSTPNGKIVEALINDGVKIGISSRGLGTLSEGKDGKIVNEDFKLITFDLVSDPSTKGAFPELTESVKLNSEKAQKILSKHKKEKVLLTILESKIQNKLSEGYSKAKPINKAAKQDSDAEAGEKAIANKKVSTSRGSSYDIAQRKGVKHGDPNAGLKAAGRLARKSDSKPDATSGRISKLAAIRKAISNRKQECVDSLINGLKYLSEEDYDRIRDYKAMRGYRKEAGPMKINKKPPVDNKKPEKTKDLPNKHKGMKQKTFKFGEDVKLSFISKITEMCSKKKHKVTKNKKS